MLVLVVGPSGAGKDTLLDAIRADPRAAHIRFARREITRPKTPGGEDHVPVDVVAFEARRDAGAYALHWQAHGLCYGISSEVALWLAEGETVVASVSRAVIAEAATRFPVRVVEITAPVPVLAARLALRGREGEAEIAGRLARQVRLPEGIDVATVMNDTTIEAGASALLDAITRGARDAATRAAANARPG